MEIPSPNPEHAGDVIDYFINSLLRPKQLAVLVIAVSFGRVGVTLDELVDVFQHPGPSAYLFSAWKKKQEKRQGGTK